MAPAILPRKEWHSIGRDAVGAISVFMVLGTAICLFGAIPSAQASGTTLPGGQDAAAIVVSFADPPARQSRPTGLLGHSSRSLANHIPTETVSRRVKSVARRFGLQVVSQSPIRLLGIHSVVFQLPEGSDIETVLHGLGHDADVESAQPLNVFHVMISGYDDPYWRLQQGVRDLGLVEAHQFSSGRGVRIAVIDTGADLRHPELINRVYSWRSFVAGDTHDLSADRHGTAVAGVIASNANNGEGIIGVAPDAELQVLKACWQEDYDKSGAAVCNSFTLAQAVAYAIESGAQVMNMSLTGPFDPLLSRLLTRAFESGITVVAAAGGGDDPGFPANLDTVIGVSTPAGVPVSQLLNLSNAPVLAPGHDIITPIPDGGYEVGSGSSLAAAHVSGVIALLLEMAPELDPVGIERVLRGPATARASIVPAPGVVHACSSIARVLPDVSCHRKLLPTEF